MVNPLPEISMLLNQRNPKGRKKKSVDIKRDTRLRESGCHVMSMLRVLMENILIMDNIDETYLNVSRKLLFYH